MVKLLRWGALWSVFELITFLPTVQSETAIPQIMGDRPVGVILEGQYMRDGRSLLGPPPADENAPQRLARRYVQLTASKDKEKLLELYFADDGSKARMAPLLDRSDAFRPKFSLSSAALIEQLRWGDLTVLIIALRGNPALRPETQPLFCICPEAQTCHLVFPQFGTQNREFKTLDTVLKLFSKYSTPATSEQRQTFLARAPLVVALKPNPAYASPAGVPVEVKLLVEPYVNVPPISASGNLPLSYEERPELKALFVLLQRLRAMNNNEITDSNKGFRQFMDQEFHADYAANVYYRINRLMDGEYVDDSLSAADFVKAIRSWDSLEPACAVRHGDTVFVYVRAGRGEEAKSLQLFPVKVSNDRANFESLKFANYIASLLQIPELLRELEKSCKTKQLK